MRFLTDQWKESYCTIALEKYNIDSLPYTYILYSVNQWCMGIVSLKSNNVICKEENLKYGKETVLYNKSCKTFAKRYTVQIQCNVVVSENRNTAVLKKLNF